jgi:hypothetical protein
MEIMKEIDNEKKQKIKKLKRKIIIFLRKKRQYK